MDVLLSLDVPTGTRPLDRDELRDLATAGAAELAGRWAEGMAAVPFTAVAGLVEVPDEITHATFHAADGYAASLPIEQVLADGVLLVPGATSGKLGVRLVVDDAGTTCVNVKAVRRIELRRGPGKDTVDPDPHENPAVPGWDG